MTMVNRLHVGLPELGNRVLVELTSHCPSQLCLVDIAVIIPNAGKSGHIELFNVNHLNQRHHKGSQLLKFLLKALVQ